MLPTNSGILSSFHETCKALRYLPQPQQQQGVEYFAGSWRFEYIGRESPVGAGPRAGTVTFTRKGASNVLDMRTEGQTDAGTAYKESGTAEWNDEQKTMTFRERSAGGVELVSPGNWSSPLAIRSETQPIKAGNQTVRVRRVYSIISGVARLSRTIALSFCTISEGVLAGTNQPSHSCKAMSL